MSALTAEEAEAQGWTVDRTCYPWFAYEGGRFAPTASIEVATPAHPAGAEDPGRGAVDLVQVIQAVVDEFYDPEPYRSAGKPTRANNAFYEIDAILRRGCP